MGVEGVSAGMDRHTPPLPPDRVEQALSADVCEELPNREVETLEALREWIDDVIAYRRRRRSDVDLPSVVLSETTGQAVLSTLGANERTNEAIGDLLGSFSWQLIECGSESCDCADGRPETLHGPYLRRDYLDGSGHYASEYVPRNDRRQQLVRRVIPKPSVADLEGAHSE
jgi:hypothetical protein